MAEVASNSVEEEFLWSCTLTGSSKEFTWAPEDPADQDEEDESDPTVKPGHRLLIKKAMLMPSATADEVSLIQVETEGYNKTKVVVPFVAMMGGRDYNSYIDLLIPKKATFKLIQGEGPISLVGSHCLDFYGERWVGDPPGWEEDETDEGNGETEKKKKKKKKKNKEKKDKKTPSKEGGSGGKKLKASEEKTSSQEKKKKEDK